MYRDDLAAAHARLDQLQRELAEASSQGVQDRQRIAALTSQLAATRDALARMGAQPPAPYAQPVYVYPSRAGTVLTLGILSLVLCTVLGPIAWSMGNEELRRIDGGMVPAYNRSTVVAGKICGIIGTAFLIFAGFALLIMFAAVPR